MEPLQIQELETPKPNGQQILIRVHSTGVCHSDIHLWEGGYEGIDGHFMRTTDRGVKYPMTPGHEIAGTVDKVGENVLGFTAGDKVIVYPWIGEGLCPACRMGEENLCDKPRSLGVLADGGYSEFVLVPSYRYLIKIDDSLDINMAATLACSSLTAYNAVKNANLKPSDNVVIVGAGGLGLMAMQMVKAVKGPRVIAMDLNDDKLNAAKHDGGADETINSSQVDVVNGVKEMTSGLGADAVIDFVNASKTVETDMQFLRKRATLVLVGLFG